MDNLGALLKKLSIIQMKFETLSQRDEVFNIFSVLHKENDERRLHSRFISALLSPKGSHKKKYLFLSEFLSVIGEDIAYFDDVEVFPHEYDKLENNNIDILIIDKKSKNAIIIENKIHAGDSNNKEGGQLDRYFKHIESKENIPGKNIRVLYLSLDGHEPTDESLGSEKSKVRGAYRCISYEIHILDWLTRCIGKVSSFPFLRESILQYITLINKMTKNISVEERLAVKQLIAKSTENMQSAKYLIENFKHVKWHTQRDFWNELSFKFKETGYTIISEPTDDDITNTAHFEDYKKGFSKNNYYGICFQPIQGMRLYVWNDHKCWLYFGCDDDKNTNRDYKSKIKKYCTNRDGYVISDSYIFLKVFNSPDSEKICFTDFSYEGTFNLINDEYRSKIIAKIVTEIKKFVDTIAKQ